jgi:hypothetical protein
VLHKHATGKVDDDQEFELLMLRKRGDTGANPPACFDLFFRSGPLLRFGAMRASQSQTAELQSTDILSSPVPRIGAMGAFQSKIVELQHTGIMEYIQVKTYSNTCDKL